MDSYTQKIMKLEESLIQYAKVNLSWVKNLHARLHTIRFLLENNSRTLWHKPLYDLFNPSHRVIKKNK